MPWDQLLIVIAALGSDAVVTRGVVDAWIMTLGEMILIS